MPKPAINRLQINYLNTHLKKATRDIVKYQTAPKVIICPFTITLGTIMQTASGYEADNVSPKDFPAYQKIFEGAEQITVVWDGSVNVKGINNQTDGTFTNQNLNYDNSYTELEFKKNGDYFSGTLHSKTINTVFKQNNLNSNITNEIAIRSYAITIPNDNNFFQRTMLDETTRTTGLLDLQEWDFYKLFLVSDDTKNSEGFQWLYLDQMSINMHTDNTVASYDLVLSSLSDRLAHTGATINQLVQIMGASCPASFPKIKWIKNSVPIISCEPAYLNRKGARALSIEYMAPTAFMSVMAHGRPYYKDSKKTKAATNGSTYFRFYAPRPLFVYDFFNAPNNPIAQVSSSNTTLTCFLKVQPVIEKWFQKLSDTWSNYYNQLNRGQEEGALSYKTAQEKNIYTYNDPLGDNTKSFEWNADGTGASGLKDLTDPSFMINLDVNTYTVNNFKPSSANDLVNCSLDYFANNPRTIQNVTTKRDWKPCDLMAFFALTNKIYTQIPMYYERTQIISGSDFFNNIGLGFLNRFSFGYNWGWSTAYDTTIGVYIQEPCWVNSNLGGYLRTEFLNASKKGTTDVKNFLPLFSFCDTASGALDQLISSQHTSLNIGGMLSDQVMGNGYYIHDGSLVFNGKQMSSVALGQIFKDSAHVNPPIFMTYDYNNFQILPPTPKFKDEEFNGYYIEQIFSRAYCKSDLTVQLYDNQPKRSIDKNGNVKTNLIYTGSFMTFSKYTNNIRNVVTSVRTAILHKNYTGRPHPWPQKHNQSHIKEYKFLINVSIVYDETDLKAMATQRFEAKSGEFFLQNDFYTRPSGKGEIDGWSIPISTKLSDLIETGNVEYIKDGKSQFKYIVIKGTRMMNFNNQFEAKYCDTKSRNFNYATMSTKFIKKKFSDKFWLVIDIQDLANIKFIDVSNYFNVNPFVQTWELNYSLRPLNEPPQRADTCYLVQFPAMPDIYVKGDSLPFYDGLVSDGYFTTLVAQLPLWHFQQTSTNTFKLEFKDNNQVVTEQNAPDKFIYTWTKGNGTDPVILTGNKGCDLPGQKLTTYCNWWFKLAPTLYEIEFNDGWLTNDYLSILKNN